MKTLPAGLLNNSIEFFVCESLNAYKLKDGRVISFDEFDDDFIAALVTEVKKQPLKLAELLKMGISNEREQVKQFLVCNYGGFDNQADVVKGVLQPTEYWPCPKRGTCPHEGKLCDSLRTETGEHLSKREVEVLQLVARGLLNKEIAGALRITETTVATHTKNIEIKTGLSRKPALTSFAAKKGLI
jgi:DNA-binding CsgD family transcriptional regulator